MPETPQQRDSQENRQLNREEETPDQRVHCLERDRNRTQRRREDETPDQHQCHLERERETELDVEEKMKQLTNIDID